MSRGNGVLCPKCNQYTENEDTCDYCGANLARILARQSGDEFGFNTSDEKLATIEEYNNPKRTNPLMLLLLIVGAGIALWMNLDFYLMKKRADAEDKARNERVAASLPGSSSAAATDQVTTAPAAREPVVAITTAPLINPALQLARKREEERRRAKEIERAQMEARQMIRGMQENVPETKRAR